MTPVRFVIIDGDIAARRSFGLMLDANSGFTCVGAHASGDLALKHILGEHPQIVLLDVLLAGMDGLDVLERVRRMACLATILMISIVADCEVLLRSVELGANGYLPEPVTRQGLIVAIWASLAGEFPTSDRVLRMRSDDAGRTELGGDALARFVRRALFSMPASPHVEEMRGYIARAAGYRVSALANMCDISDDRLETLFQEHDLPHPSEWLRHQQTEEVLRLRDQGFIEKEIFGQVGFTCLSSFSRRFGQRRAGSSSSAI